MKKKRKVPEKCNTCLLASGKRRGKGETADLDTTAAHAQDNVWNGGNW